MQKEKNLSYYAYNPEYQYKGVIKNGELNFAKLEKGFYDDIIATQSEINTSKRELESLKTNSIKEFVYSNRSIVPSWKTKLTYRDNVINALKSDQTFSDYCAGIPNPNPPMMNPITFNKTIQSQKDLERAASRAQSRAASSSKLPEISLTNNFETLSSFQQGGLTDKHVKRGASKKMSFLMSTFTPHTHLLTDKEIASKLDDYRVKYDMGKYVEKLRMAYDDDNKKKNCDVDEFQAVTEQINKKNKKKMNKAKVLKSSIYINLLPKNINEDQKNKTVRPHIPVKEEKVPFGPFLNSNPEAFRTIEITNPKIKRELEIIDYYGPRYTHCKICNNKNLDFYQNFEPNQCLKLLSYLKKVRIKK